MRALAAHGRTRVQLRIVEIDVAVTASLEQRALLFPIPQNEMDLTLGDARAHRPHDLGEDVLRAVVTQMLSSVETQPVEVILLEPVKRVADDEVAHRARTLAVETEGHAP